MVLSTYSNIWSSQPLTAAGLRRVVDEMSSKIGTRLDIRPDVIIVPPDMIPRAVHDCRLAVEKLVVKLAQPVLRGRYEQRQRRRAQGVDFRRLQRLHTLERRLVDALDTLAMFERML